MAHVGVSPSRGLKLFGREIIFKEFQPICDHDTWTSHSDRQTDRRTDRQHTTAIPRFAL